MDNKKKYNSKDIKKNKEDVTECGEFIPSYFTWITLEEQRKETEEMDKMTKENKGIDR